MGKSIKNTTIEETKKQDSNMFLSIFENSLNAILFGIPDGTVLDANSAALDMFGYTIEEIKTAGRAAIFELDAKMIAALKIREQTGKSRGELIGIRKNGERFPCEFSSAIFKTETGESRTSTILNDITERKKSEEEITLLLDNTEESFVLIDENFKIVSFNKQFKERNKLFFNRNASKGDYILDFVKDDRKDTVQNNYKKVFNGESFDDEIVFSVEGREPFIFSIWYKPAINIKGDVIGIFITLRDVTEKKKAQQQIITNEKRFRSIIEHTGDLILLTDVNGIITYVSPSVEKVIGFNASDMINKSYTVTIASDYIEESKLVFQELLRKPGIPIARVTKVSHKDGHPVWIEGVVTNLLHDENVNAIVFNYRDITEKIASNKQKEFEKNNRDALINSTGDLIWSINTEFKLITANNAFITFLKNAVGADIKPGDSALIENKSPNEFVIFWKKLYKIGLKGKPFKQEAYIPELLNIKPSWFEINVNPIYDKEQIIGIVCCGRNITEKKNSQLKLKESFELFEKLTFKIPAAIYQFEMRPDGKMRFPYISEGIEKINPNLNIELLKEDAGSAFASVHPDDLEKLIISIEVSKNNLTDWELEYRSIINEDKIIWTKGKSSPEKKEDGTIVWYGYFQDITEQKITNEEVRESKERYDIIAKATNDTIWDLDLNSNTIKWSNGITTIYGYSENDPSIYDANWWYTKIHPDDIDYVKKKSDYWIQSKEIRCEFEYRFMCFDGTYKYVYDRGFLVVNEFGPVKIIGAMQDITERKIAEKKYILSEHRFKAIFDAEPECVKLIGINGELIEINAAGIELHEANSLEEIISLPISNFIVPEHRESFKNLHSQTISGKKGFLEFEIIGLRGTQRWLEAYTAPILDDKGIVTMMLSVTRDITERKVAEQKLIESQKRFKTIFETVPECVNLIGVKGELLEMNAAGLVMLEADSLYQVKSHSLMDFVLPEYKKAFGRLQKRVMKGHDEWLEFEIVGLRGTKRVLETYAVPMKDAIGDVTMMLAVTRDVTKRKEEEYHLKLLESVIKNANDAVVITDAESNKEPDPKIVFVNEAFTRMTGYTEEEIIGKSPRFLQGSKSDITELKRLKEALRKHKPCEITTINYKKNGEELWVNLSVSPISDDRGKVTHWISIERDVTQKKQYELEREHIIAELSQNNKDLKQFSYVTSHNLRAPIANLLGLSSLIDNYKIPNKSLKQILDGIKQSALMFDDTVKDLSKVLIIKDQTNVTKQELSLVSMIDKTLSQLSITVDDNEVKINYEFKRAPFIMFTSSYLESIFINLFTNALKYKSNQRKLKIDISSEDTEEYVVVKFKDNGIGIDIERHREKLFKLYQRFHENSDGKGLGLYLVKSQMEAFGGTIDVESEVGKGTTFILKFKKYPKE